MTPPQSAFCHTIRNADSHKLFIFVSSNVLRYNLCQNCHKNITKHDNRIVSACFENLPGFLLVLPIPMAAFYYFKIGTALYIVVGTALLSLDFFSFHSCFSSKNCFLNFCRMGINLSFEIIHLVLYQESVGPGFVLLLFQTNFQEMWELIVYHKFPTIVYLITAILYFFITIKFIKNEYLLPKQFRLFALIVLLLFMVALYAFTFKSVYSTKRTTSDILLTPTMLLS